MNFIAKNTLRVAVVALAFACSFGQASAQDDDTIGVGIGQIGRMLAVVPSVLLRCATGGTR